MAQLMSAFVPLKHGVKQTIHLPRGSDVKGIAAPFDRSPSGVHVVYVVHEPGELVTHEFLWLKEGDQVQGAGSSIGAVAVGSFVSVLFHRRPVDV